MKIFRPGMAPVYVDEPAPPQETNEANPLPSVEAAIAAANARQAQILNYTRSSAPIGPDNPISNGQNPVSVPVVQHTPHSINDKPEVNS